MIARSKHKADDAPRDHTPCSDPGPLFVKLNVSARTSGLIAAMSPRCWQTLTVLATYMDEHGECFPSQEEIAKALGVSRKAVIERLHELTSFRWRGKPIVEIAKERTKGWATNRYIILPDAGWAFGNQPPVSRNRDTEEGKAGANVTRNGYTLGNEGEIRMLRNRDTEKPTGEANMSRNRDTHMSRFRYTNKIHIEQEKEKKNTVSLSSSPSSKKKERRGDGLWEAETATAPRADGTRAAQRHEPPDTEPTSSSLKGNPSEEQKPTSDVQILLRRHARLFEERFGEPCPLAWKRDGAIFKRLLKIYSRERLEELQDAFFALPDDAFAVRAGLTVTVFANQLPSLISTSGLSQTESEYLTPAEARELRIRRARKTLEIFERIIANGFEAARVEGRELATYPRPAEIPESIWNAVPNLKFWPPPKFVGAVDYRLGVAKAAAELMGEGLL